MEWLSYSIMFTHSSASWITHNQLAATQTSSEDPSTQGQITQKVSLNHKKYVMSSAISKKTINIQVVKIETRNLERSVSTVDDQRYGF
jgi:hypothetical protein